ncbi:3-oxo-tetronate kinase [Agarivorans sp. DSG3-1]|uniref:3-oxo-tetronate kinase n=1 Tax=Agarivorans sp. DSG3-1 TaxID=3342249 RepID=UPI00398F1442
MRLGIIADDFTGATDIASFLVENGLSAIQFSGIPKQNITEEPDAIVVSLKSRSCPVELAVGNSLAALEWLKNQGCERFYFKYCSTFDSTAAGNIGPVTDALLAALDFPYTIVCPALPVNGRTVINGQLFVHHQLLNASGMRHHPVTPMVDSDVARMMEQQSQGKAANIFYPELAKGNEYLAAKMAELADAGAKYLVLDTLDEQHLNVIASASANLPLVTGGSGLAAGIAHCWPKASHIGRSVEACPRPSSAVVLSGSCSDMTNQQVALYQAKAASHALDIERCFNQPDYPEELAQWVLDNQRTYAPMIYATADRQALSKVQQQFGEQQASQAIERFFAQVSVLLADKGVQNFIVAGGETSGAVTQALKVNGLRIGPQIAPGVPWVRALDKTLYLALKSGNFGEPHFFAKAQELIHE